eukprot:g89.t1
MQHFCATICIFCFCVLSVSAVDFSQATREDAVAFLEKITYPHRNQVANTNGVPTLVDFLASSSGLQFLKASPVGILSQTKLEQDYRRTAICENLSNQNTKQVWSSWELRFRDCVCTPSLPYLHCLAIGSQMLIEQGYTTETELKNASRTDLADHEIQTRVLLSEELELVNEEETREFEPKETRTPCVPTLHPDQTVCFGGNCNIPIAKLLDIKVHNRVCSGDSTASNINLEKCIICGFNRSSPGKCVKICKDYLPMVERMFENAAGNSTVDICVNLGTIGSLFKMVFGGDNCFQGSTMTYWFYQRLLRMTVSQSNPNLKLEIGVDYKYTDGPYCICELSGFSCARSCKMKQDDVVGFIVISWDFFFATGSHKWNSLEPHYCYTEFAHLAEKCEE